ncbi:MAG: hypothetical protein AAB601_01595 [Patescibacteria group bacterium]
MTQKSISNRVKITRRGKVRRRATTLGHSRSNKTSVQMQRKGRERGLRGVRHTFLQKNLS